MTPTVENPIVITSYPLPFFPDYTIDIPSSYNGGRDLTGIAIKSKKGKPVRVTTDTYYGKENTRWVLKNPDSNNPDYQKLYKKNVVGTLSQSLYDSDIRAIYKYLKVLV